MKKYIKEKINELTSLLEEELGIDDFEITIKNFSKEVSIQSRYRDYVIKESKNGRN